jgi:hydroxymethylglutaryl-CoA synthase
MFVAMGLVKAGEIKYGLGVGADTSQGAPGDALEYSASAGAAAFIFGKDDVIAECTHTHSWMTDTPDFWRREHQFYPSHASRFTGEPAYFRTIMGCANALLEKSGLKPEDFQYAVFHQPNGKFPMTVGKRLGFTEEQMHQGWLCPTLGNTYSGASPIGLSAILDVAKPGDKIFMVSYGSGAGSDGFVFQATDRITKVQDKAVHTRAMLDSDNRRYLDYGTYSKYRGKIKLRGE